MSVFLDWQKCKAGKWCALLDLDLDHDHFDQMNGVYIIWAGEHNPVALRVGQGCIRDCLVKERDFVESQTYNEKHNIRATWAKAGPTFCGGVVRYLVDVLQPLLRSPYAEVEQIEVNLPAPWYEESFPWD